jgi:hypothetical protein
MYIIIVVITYEQINFKLKKNINVGGYLVFSHVYNWLRFIFSLFINVIFKGDHLLSDTLYDIS